MRALIENRIKKMRTILENTGKKAILLSKAENIAYLTLGARNHITFNTTEGVASILITPDEVYFITNNIEMNRLFREEIPADIGDLFTKIEYNWWDLEFDEIARLARMKEILSDSGRYLTTNISTDINSQRYILGPHEFSSLRELGKFVDQVFYEKMPLLRPDMKEIEVQAAFFAEFLKRDYEPILVLVFGEESSRLYRHNLPRNAKLGNSCFVSVCVRHKGLIISSTRSVLFSQSQTMKEQHERNCRIDAKLIAMSRPGMTMDKLFTVLEQAYESEGYKDEWILHHQGGLAGYKSRELICTPTTKYTLREGNCIAFNPTITGTKSEDTAILLKAENEIVSFPKNSKWPFIEFEFNSQKIRRPDMIIV